MKQHNVIFFIIIIISRSHVNICSSVCEFEMSADETHTGSVNPPRVGA